MDGGGDLRLQPSLSSGALAAATSGGSSIAATAMVLGSTMPFPPSNGLAMGNAVAAAAILLLLLLLLVAVGLVGP